MRASYKTVIQLRADTDLRAAVEAAAKRSGTTVSGFIRRELRTVVGLGGVPPAHVIAGARR